MKIYRFATGEQAHRWLRSNAHAAFVGILPVEEMKYPVDKKRNNYRKLHPEHQIHSQFS